MGPLLIVVAYAPNDQDCAEEKDLFYSDLDCVMSNGNGLVMVMGDFNASVSERVRGVVGPYGLARHISDNGVRLVSFVSANGMCIANTFFLHKRIHQASWYPIIEIMERATEYRTTVHLGFVDLTKAYDSVDPSALLAILRHYRVPQQLIDIIKELYTRTWCCVRTVEGTSEDFEVKNGVRQGCVLSLCLHVEYTTSGGLFLSYRNKTPMTTCIQNTQYMQTI